MTSPRYPSEAVLLADVTWVRDLARNLVRDAVMADDAAQEAWLAALKQTQGPRTSLRAWLGGATRNAVRKAYRSEGRRQVHEEAAARPERTPSTAEVVEGLSTQLTVARAVNVLDEPYRETIHLRYYEDLSLKEIATRMETPLATVAARVQRGLGMLQRVLERQLGAEGHNWALALLPLFDGDPASGPLAPPTALGAGAAKVVILGIMAVVAGFGLRALVTQEVEPEPVSTGLPVVVDSTPKLSSPSEAGPSGGDARVRATGTQSVTGPVDQVGESKGSIRARVLFSDGTPARDLPVEVRSRDGLDPRRAIFRTRTSQGGELSLDGLPTGEWTLFPSLGKPRVVEVKAAQPTLVTLHLPPGPALSGVVVDGSGEPVPNAGVWLSLSAPREYAVDRLVQSTIADDFILLTDGEGAFHLNTIGAALTIGARAQGLCPSPAYSLAEQSGPAFELRLVLEGEGGALSGVVSDADGHPVAGAAVFVDVGSTERTLPDGRRASSTLPLVRTYSDGSGRFHLSGVRPGSREILVRAAGLAPWRGEAQVRAGVEVRVDMELRRGMGVEGTVTDGSGAGLGGVLVWTSRRRWSAAPDARHAVGSRTDSDGHYRIDGLQAGHAWITVDGGPLGTATELLVGDSEQEFIHDVVLSPGPVLHGRVLDGEGAGIEGLTVRARRPDDWRSRGTHTDRTGAFTIIGLEDEAYILRVEEDGVELVGDLQVRPSEEPTLIRVDPGRRPSARVSGLVVEADGSDGRVNSVRLTGVDDQGVLKLAVENGPGGSFRTAAIPPGAWRVALLVEGHPELALEGEHVLTARQELDLGRIDLQPAGILRLRLAAPQGGGLFDLGLNILDAEGRLLHDLWLSDPQRHLPLTLPVHAGVTTVRAWAAGFAPFVQGVTVEQGVAEVVELRFEPGVASVLRFGLTESAPAPGPVRLRLVVLDLSGATLLEQTVLRSGDEREFPFVVTVDLLPGVYEVRAQTPDLEARGPLTVHSTTTGSPLDLVLEPK
jgi:RNA polymerase sigma factor (sigma-70 family)